MVRKIGFGFLWFIVIYMGSAMLIGAVAGAMAGVNSPENANEAGRLAGAAVVESIRIYLFLGAAILAFIGSAKGFLPGTRAKA